MVQIFPGRGGWFIALFENADGTFDVKHFQPKSKQLDATFGEPLNIDEAELAEIAGELAFYTYSSIGTRWGEGLIDPDPSNAVQLRDFGVDADGSAAGIISLLPDDFECDFSGPLGKVIYPANDGSDRIVLRASISNLKLMVGVEFRLGDDREIYLAEALVGYVNGIHATDNGRFVAGAYNVIGGPDRADTVQVHELGDVWLLNELVNNPVGG